MLLPARYIYTVHDLNRRLGPRFPLGNSFEHMSGLKDAKTSFQKIAPAGFYIALRVGFSFPEEELNLLPEIWVEFYTAHGLVVHDPAMRWAYDNTGAIRFSDMDLPDPHQVIPHAAVFGLSHGAVVSVLRPQDRGRRSYALFFREDRDFSPAELRKLQQMMTGLHQGDDPALTPAELQALRLQSEGHRLKQIAAQLGISESAVKARLNNVKRKLGARTQSQAVSIATARRLL
jgi:LuxR family transcriptional regulator, quorum-sensing system regulator SdiA